MRTALAAALIAFAPVAAHADETTGMVLAYDRVANVIVLEDTSVWSLETLAEKPADLAAGKTVTITFTSDGDNGVKTIDALAVES